MPEFFSDLWHRVASLRIELIPSALGQRQTFRGEPWVIVKDSLTDRYFRMRPDAWFFVARLDRRKTIEEHWRLAIEHDPEKTPGQEELIQLLAQLYHSHLLRVDHLGDVEQLLQRHDEQRQREWKGQLFSFMSLRIPLHDPEPWLKRLQGLIKVCLSPPGFVLWFIVLLLGAASAITHSQELADQSQGMLAPSNLPWLYCCLFTMKTLHEIAHAAVCKRFGGEVHTLGIMFLLFTPLPYMDATASWSFRNKWHRILVGFAGMFLELFLASCAAIIWSQTAPGAIHGIAFNVMIIGSVSSLVFNGNPLIRFDAYYILTDLIESPNIYQRSRLQLNIVLEKILFNVRDQQPVASTITESIWLSVYGVFSLIYRWSISIGIILFFADASMILGMLMLSVTVVSQILLPLKKTFAYLLWSPKFHDCRFRVLSISFGILSIFIYGLLLMPIADPLWAPGIVESEEMRRIYAETAGNLSELEIQSGEWIEKGQVIAQLENKDLELDILTTHAQLEESQALEMLMRNQDLAQLNSVNMRIQLLNDKLETLNKRFSALIIRAPLSGYWYSPHMRERKGTWLKERQLLGTLLHPDKYQFIAVISQEQATRLFDSRKLEGEIRLWGSAENTIRADDISVLPSQTQELPSAVLGWLGGGDIAISNRGNGTLALESFYISKVPLKTEQRLFHGQSGRLRIEQEDQPLGRQLWRKLNQLLQKRYKL